MRRTILTLSLCAAAPLAAQQQQSAWTPPAGWTIQVDKEAANAADTKFVTMGAGYYVTSGPAALYYRSTDQPGGAFTVSANFGVRKGGPPGHFEAYGLFIGGSDLLDAAKQQYFYFVVRGDGKFYVAHRYGTQVHGVVPWTEHEAVKKQNDAGSVSQALAVAVTADSVHLSANGQRVQSFAKSEMKGFNTDGQAGLRVNHNLDLHVGSFEVKK